LSKFTVIDGDAKPDQVGDLLRRYDQQWNDFIRLQEYEAKRLRAVYESLLAAGFDEEQALALTQ
jgi:hypothetical protein